MKTETLSVAAPYIIEQDYSAYTDEQHAVWAELVGRVLPEFEKHASRAYLDGFQIIGLQKDRLPQTCSRSARDLSREPAGIPRRSADFCRRRRFLRCWPRAVFRPRRGCAAANRLNTRPSRTSFTTSLAMFRCTRIRFLPISSNATAAFAHRSKMRRCLKSWAGCSGTRWSSALIREGNEIKVYGSGLISSHGECKNVIEGHCAVHDFSLDEVLDTPVKVDELHKLLFAVSSFDQIYEAMHEAEQPRRCKTACER